MEPTELSVTDDKLEYGLKEIRDLLKMLNLGNRQKQGQKTNTGFNRTVSAFGIVGFVKFLEGYYIILITKRRRVAEIGHHTIYKIEDTCMVYIPNDGDRNTNPDESRYLKMFQNIDLSSNFYFSYSYDLSHTLQYNLAPLKVSSHAHSCDTLDQTETALTWNLQMKTTQSATVEVAENFLASLQSSGNKHHQKIWQSKSTGPEDSYSSTGSESEVWSELRQTDEHQDSSTKDSEEGHHYGVRCKPHWKFVWNTELLEPFDIHSDWKLYIIHGFIGQSNISVYGKPLYLTLIARRSQKFAGTRFLKRGSNCEGHVANEVETEQIIHDSSVSSFTLGHFTAFVQMRGSVPSHWSQDISKMVPKPPISLDKCDPFSYTAGQHFNQLLRRYGAPIICLNLVKKRETRRHESILGDEFTFAIDYLNQFLPPQHHIKHIWLDMARVNKLKEVNVMDRLSKISYGVLRKTGIFQSWPRYYCQDLPYSKQHRLTGGFITESGSVLQTGVVRVNCIDCLDRTNTAQFALGKCAMAFQLYALGVSESPHLEFDTDSVRMLEELYEDHGDTLALQYGGSQLVHRIKSYRKIAPLSSHSRDIMQTVSRYYSNTFSDADKQNVINLFLQVYQPYKHHTPLWDLPTDYYLHNPTAAGKIVCHRNLYTRWWDEDVAGCLPLALDEVIKGHKNTLVEVYQAMFPDERIDGFFEHYRPYEMSVLNEIYSFIMAHSIRDFMPSFTNNCSPFSVRVQPGKRRESGGRTKPPNPSVSGISSTSSTSSSTEDTDTDESSDEDFILTDSNESNTSDSIPKHVTFSSVFTTMKESYGIHIMNPSVLSDSLYKRYVTIGERAILYKTEEERKDEYPKNANLRKTLWSQGHINLICHSALPLDSSYEVVPPTVARKYKDIYQDYVFRGQKGAKKPSPHSINVYKRYVTSKFK
ncbi:polyphosphoinositide phosphatase FIG4 isoform X2 [Tachypleus tridentatus]